MNLPIYQVGDEVTYRRKYNGETGTGVICSAFTTTYSGAQYRLTGLIPIILEEEIISKTVEEVEENTKPTPPYFHITKKSLNANRSVYPYSNDYLSNGHGSYAQRSASHDHWDKHVLSNVGPKKYKVPVHYMVTTYVHITAESQYEAIQKAQHVEAPQLEVWDNTAHDTVIESEVCPYDIEEIEDDNGPF